MFYCVYSWLIFIYSLPIYYVARKSLGNCHAGGVFTVSDDEAITFEEFVGSAMEVKYLLQTYLPVQVARGHYEKSSVLWY